MRKFVVAVVLCIATIAAPVRFAGALEPPTVEVACEASGDAKARFSAIEPDTLVVEGSFGEIQCVDGTGQLSACASASVGGVVRRPTASDLTFHFAFTATGRAQITCDQRSVDFDVKPGSDDNPINTSSEGVIPSAIHGSDTIDVHDIDAASLCFGDSEEASCGLRHWAYQDVNADGVADLVFHIDTAASGIEPGDDGLWVLGDLVDGGVIEGYDEIRAF